MYYVVMERDVLVIDGGPLAGPRVVAVARKKVKVEISPQAIELMEAARETVSQ